MTLRELQEACCKAFLQNVEDLDDVLKSYDIAVIDGKSPIVSDDQISHKRRTFGFYWKKKVRPRASLFLELLIKRLQSNRDIVYQYLVT
jgi:hypothetical protein